MSRPAPPTSKAAACRAARLNGQARAEFGDVVRWKEGGREAARGARPTKMMWMTLRENLRLAAIGAAIGIAAAAASLRVLDGLLFGLSPTDTVNLVSAAPVLVLVSLAVAVVPAQRAAAVDPLMTLRSE